jgi:hypothetical protein
VAFKLTRQERDLIVERTLVDAELEGRLCNARASGSDLIVDLTLDDVDDLAGHVAAEANHCSEAGARRVLDALYDRLANLEDTFTDEEDQSADGVTNEAQPFTRSKGSISRSFTTTRRSMGGRRPRRIFSGSSASFRLWCTK